MSDNISVDEYQRIIDGLDNENDMLMILIILLEEEDTSEEENFVFSRNRHVHRQMLGAEERWHRSGYIPRCALHDPISSAFSTLYRSNDDGSLLTVTGYFSPMYDIMSPYSKDGNI